MMSHQRQMQSGFSFISLLFWGGLLSSVFLIGAQVGPTVAEFRTIQKAVEKAKDEPTVTAIRAAFDRTASIDNIESISGTDLAISKQGDKTVVSFAYNREFHLVGPAYLTVKYVGRSR
jgi:hypothetical protein